MGYISGIVLLTSLIAFCRCQQCSFDEPVNPMCGWTISTTTTNYHWQLREGGTPVPNTGPPSDRSGVGSYIYARSSVETKKGFQRLPKRSRARITSRTMTIGNHMELMRFHYYMHGTQLGALYVFVAVKGDMTPPSPVWRRGGELGPMWHMGEIRLPANSTVKVYFEAVVGKGIHGDIAIDDITMHVLEADCTFESSPISTSPACRFEQANEDHFDWMENTGKTPTRRTGPAIDHTLEQSRGTYMYIEATGPNQDEKAHLISPRFTKTDGPCMVSFWYHMYGEHVGKLKVHIMQHVGHLGSPRFSVAGNNGNIWNEGTFNITDVIGSYQVVFEGVRGDGSAGDIALDDFKLLGPDCITEESMRELYRNETSRDHCSPNPCTHGGSCMPVIGGYRCNCTDGWGGTTCNREHLISSCSGRPCLNEGHCVVVNSTVYSCQCPSGWTGANCESVIAETPYWYDNNPCRNNATFLNYTSDYECDCTEGWSGKDCDIVDSCQHDGDEGDGSPCAPGGQCESLPGGRYRCNCFANFTDAYCRTEIPVACQNQPCKNGGSCNGTGIAYTCDCTAGWTGPTCEIDTTTVDKCLSNPCLNGGTCRSYPRSFECSCTTLWRGPTCSDDFTALDKCLSNPCLNGATCRSFPLHVECLCSQMWTGGRCEIDRNSIDKCDSSPCQNDAGCTSYYDRFECNCTDGWTGVNCEQDIDECSLPVSACHNGGTCTNTVGGFNCTCLHGWHSDNCELECSDSSKNCQYWAAVGECKVNPNYMLIYCQKACGVCQKYVCEDSRENCPDWQKLGECVNNPYYMMANCHYSCGVCIDDECSSYPCFNGATCVDGVDSYTCTCATGYEGVNCEIDTDECLSQPCLNNGTCTDAPYGFECTCTELYKGTFCEADVDYCWSNPCLNNATCVDDLQGYNCTCQAGFEGDNCEVDIDECASSPCQHSGTCEDGVGGYSCLCVQEWTGTECQYDFDECLSNPCLNDGTCYHGVGHRLFICNCRAGWQGTVCEEEINECASAPCKNGAMCEDLEGAFNCLCSPGWSGITCADDVLECASSPCLNGECIEGRFEYECLCFAGYTGSNCETAIDLCQSGPCQNGGTCLSVVNGHICLCADTYEGRYCEEDVTTTPPTTTAYTTTTVTPTKDTNVEYPSWLFQLSFEDEFSVPSDDESYISEGSGDEATTENEPPAVAVNSTSEIVFVDTTIVMKTTSGNEVTDWIDFTTSTTTGEMKTSSGTTTEGNEIPQDLTTTKQINAINQRNKTPAQTNPRPDDSTTTTGHIVAVVFGGLLFLAILAFLIVVLVRQRRKSRIGKYEHFSMDSKDSVAWKEMDTRSLNEESTNTESLNM